MDVTRKDATITNTDEDFPGSFQVVLSTPSKDRDGDELATEDWKQPLPEHITFDIDHGMSVEKTVGSGKPYLDDQGRIIVDGTYSSLTKAQDTRTLVKEGHIRTVSVAFMSEKTTKDGKSRVTRELLNGAFVAIPSNRDSLVLASKALDVKAGARNSKTDAERIQAIHDHAVALGASSPSDDTGAAEGATGGKSVRWVAMKAVDGSYEQREQAIGDALQALYPGDDMWAYTLATFDDTIVYRVSGSTPQLQGQWQADYTYDNGVATIGTPTKVNLVEQVVPMKSVSLDPALIVKALTDALNTAQSLTTDEAVQKALTAAEETVDELADALGAIDHDETDPGTGDAPTAEKSVEKERLELQHQAIQIAALAG